MPLLDGKIALITGAGSGIGRAVAQRFVEEGATIAACDINEDAIYTVADAMNKVHGKSVLPIVMDVGNPESIQRGFNALADAFTKIDVLVNCAGIHISHPFISFPLDAAEKVFRINYFGSLLCSQIAAKMMIKGSKGGSIIHIASASGKKADPGGSAYNSSKSAIIGLSRVMALELGKNNIRVNCVLPGATDTGMLRSVLEAEPGLKELLAKRTPLGKMASPMDQANACVFLASDLAAHITGEQLVVSGGEFMES